MIRVLLRHVNSVDGTLVGDFSPDQLDELLARFRGTTIYLDESDCQLTDDPTQFVMVDASTPRIVFEIIVDDIPD